MLITGNQFHDSPSLEAYLVWFSISGLLIVRFIINNNGLRIGVYLRWRSDTRLRSTFMGKTSKNGLSPRLILQGHTIVFNHGGMGNFWKSSVPPILGLIAPKPGTNWWSWCLTKSLLLARTSRFSPISNNTDRARWTHHGRIGLPTGFESSSGIDS